MPELPEVQTVVNSILPTALGARVVRVEITLPTFVQPPGTPLPELLVGRSIQQIHRRGKRMIFTLDNGMRFLIHLGMTGRLTHHPPGTPRPLHTHIVLLLDRPGQQVEQVTQVELHLCDPRRFGEIRWLANDPGDAGLGIEPFDLTPAKLFALLKASHRPIKNLLLDQSAIAGLGNIYADESLSAADLHPCTPADKISAQQALRLCRTIKGTLRKALKHHGSSLRDYVDSDGGKGSFQKLHRVYGREGQPCRSCQTPIQRLVLAGRSTCFCPKCQPSVPSN